jgi:hypothetical protein
MCSRRRTKSILALMGWRIQAKRFDAATALNSYTRFNGG